MRTTVFTQIFFLGGGWNTRRQTYPEGVTFRGAAAAKFFIILTITAARMDTG
jgi:hypothetical protein